MSELTMSELILEIILWIFGAAVICWFAFWIVLAIAGSADIITRRRRPRR